jgi:hypothetical protein
MATANVKLKYMVNRGFCCAIFEIKHEKHLIQDLWGPASALPLAL